MKREFLDAFVSRPNTWTHVWVVTDDGPMLVELYKRSNKLMWTDEMIGIPGDSELLRKLAQQLDDGLVFTEEELMSYEYGK